MLVPIIIINKKNGILFFVFKKKRASGSIFNKIYGYPENILRT